MTEIANPKHRRFIDHYVDSLNQTTAYQAAYPKASYESARANGCRLLTNANIRDEIIRRLEEQTMPRSEVLARITQLARGTMADFLRIDGAGRASVDIAQAVERGALGIAKRIQIKRRILRSNEEEQIISEVTTVELYDKLAALDKLARHMGLYTDNPVTIDVHNIDVKALTDEELERLIAKGQK